MIQQTCVNFLTGLNLYNLLAETIHGITNKEQLESISKSSQLLKILIKVLKNTN